MLGHIQSGKTTSFTSVIAKAADSGYRIFIVLSGIHNALREQTYSRLKRQLIDPTEANWIDLTHDGDFTNPNPAAQLLAEDDKRALAVVKKNPHRLKRLLTWLEAAPEEFQRSRPVLVIDDEADQASIDVGKSRQSTINRGILEVLDRPKAAYVAYTATPFANVLIDPDAGNLYPRHFIVDLPEPEGHFGTAQIFGRLPITEDENVADLDGLDIVRTVPDDEASRLRPPRKRDDQAGWEFEITPSLSSALDYFVLASAARRSRGQHDHSSMLVHTTISVAPQLAMQGPIREYLEELGERWARSTAHEGLRALWEREQTSLPSTSQGLEAVRFEDLAQHVETVLGEIDVIVDNYKSPDRLSYGDEPRTVVAIGGNTLSRGLTLEGLVVSYFVRAASAYDTLLQMGRWFGFERVTRICLASG